MGSAASVTDTTGTVPPETITEEQFKKQACTNDLFSTKADLAQYIADSIPVWPITRATALDIYLTQTRKNAKRVESLSACIGDEIRQTLVRCVREASRKVLKEAQPDEHFLPVTFAEVANHIWAVASNAAQKECNAYATQTLGFSRENVHDFYHSKVAVRKDPVVTAPPIIQSAIKWTAPQDHQEFQPIKKSLNDHQVEFEKAFGGDDRDLQACKESLREDAEQQVRCYGAFLRKVQENEAVNCAEIIELTKELTPQYADVYTATGKMVKHDGHYGKFNQLELDMFKDINGRHKPQQPTRDVVDLLSLSAGTQTIFGHVMCSVQDRVNCGKIVTAGGVRWKPAPLKKLVRILEKLCFLPQSRDALDSGQVSVLDAGGMLDIVRGMFLCSTMQHAGEVLNELRRLTECKIIHLERSKNRFASPSSGGWMDCLVNIRMPGNGLVCEVQIVHCQLLTIRSELGAHHSYATYRAGAEVLESIGLEGLLQGFEAQRLTLLEQALTAFVDASGNAFTLPSDKSERTHIAKMQRFGHVSQAMNGRNELRAFHPLMRADVSFVKGLPQLRATPPHENSLSRWVLQTGFDGAHVNRHKEEWMLLLATQSSKPTALLSQTLEAGNSFSVAFSPDGKLLASGSDDKTVKLWNADDGSLVRTLEGHADRVNSVAFSPDGKLLASGSNDKTVKLWNAEDGSLVRTLEGHAGWALSVAFSPDGKQLASGSEDKTSKLYLLC